VRPSPDTLTPDLAVVSLTLLATGLDVDTGVALCFSPPSLRSRRYWTGRRTQIRPTPDQTLLYA
jgi:hypothetical protein